MKKISIALGILVAISVGAWVYLATKFERIAKEEILPQIKNSEYLIDADIESAIIEKFKFQVTLKDVIIFPKSKALMVFSDEVVACYNPLNDKIIAKFKSDKFKGGSGKTEIYFTASDKKIEFNRAFLNNKFENANIVISSGEINTYFANDNSEISHLDKSNISLISKLDKEGFYNIDLKLNIEGIESNPESKYFKYMFEELVPNLAQQQPVDKRFEKIEEYYGKILSKLGPVNYNSESSLKLEKKHVENIFAALNGELEPIEIYQNFSFTSDNYLLSIKETSGNSYTSDSFNYKLVGDGSTITSDLNLVLTKNYNDIQRKDIAVLILELFNSINPQATPVSQNDLSVLLEKYLDTKQINFSFNVNYDIASRSGNHSSECKIDNLTFNAEGALKEQKYDGNLKLVTPKILVYGISDLYNGGIKFLMQRNGLDTTNSDIVVENIKTNGIEFLSAFDKKNSLKEDDSFESNITFNLENFEFKVNNKGILDLLTEERVVKFLKGMPHAEESAQWDSFMSSDLVPLRGMRDLLPTEWLIAKHIENIALDTAKLYGYEGFATPILESASVFDRTLGDTSDVVSKEMYCFPDKKGRLVALRPEFTASVMRAVISNGLKYKLPLKLFSSGPLFRYDRPQEGRQRQFHQVNFEYIGASDPYSDAETITLATHFLSNIGILQDLTLELNSLGCSETRKSYQTALVTYFRKYLGDLSTDSKQRLEQNPLRILDSKDENDRLISNDAPIISDFYSDSAKEYFTQVLHHLDNLGIQYVINPKLARGLDYYSHTTFEFTTSKLGTQSTVLAGGRYDGLATLMGEEKIPAIGFAAGIERLAMLCNFSLERERSIYIMPIGSECLDYSVALINQLRKTNIAAILEQEGKINKRLQTAVSANAKFVIFIGSEELNNNNYKLKELDTGIEQHLTLPELFKVIKSSN